MHATIRPLLAALCIGLAAPAASPETLADLIVQYEDFNRAGDPEEIAKAAGEEPTRWADVSPQYVANRAAQAADMLEALDALEELGEPVYLVDTNPTTENLAKLIYDAAVQINIPVIAVRVWESPRCSASYSPNAAVYATTHPTKSD